MTPLASAYDNIRLMRRKINIAQDDIAMHDCGARRDAAVMQLASLTDELIRILQDFADMGHEAQVARLLVHHLTQ